MRPSSISICLNSLDESVANTQRNRLDLKNFDFDVDFYYSYKRTNKLYKSFSQLINEAIDESPNEFMIFINPKAVSVSSEDVNFLIDKLCSGYCLASLIGFGFFGMTKELVRQIGMLDEYFIGGEFEDDDYLFRIKLANKKVYWGHNFQNYRLEHSYYPPERGCSYTYFWNKWRFDSERTIFNPDLKILNSEKKISPRHSEKNHEIFKSWGTFEESWGEGHVWGNVKKSEINISEYKTESLLNSISIGIKSGSDFFIEMSSTYPTCISFCIIDLNERKLVNHFHLLSGYWRVFRPNKEMELYELRIYHDGNILYINTISNQEDINLEFKAISKIIK